VSDTAVITVESVQKIEGVSKKTGKPYSKYVVHASHAGGEFSTFDGGLAQTAHGLIGKRAEVSFESGKFGNDLAGIREAAQDGHEEFRAVTADGLPDWDVKDLRINRCAFWKELLGPSMQAGIALWRAENPEGKLNDLTVFVHGYAKRLRQIAEADIYSDKQPAGPDEWLPFAWRDRYGLEPVQTVRWHGAS